MTWRFLRHNPVARVTAATAFLVGFPLTVLAIPLEARMFYSDTCVAMPFLVLAVWTFRRRLAAATDAERAFWNLLTAGVACWIGQQVLLLVTYRRPVSVGHSIAGDVLYVALYLFLVQALDLRPHLRPEADPPNHLTTLRHAGTMTRFNQATAQAGRRDEPAPHLARFHLRLVERRALASRGASREPAPGLLPPTFHGARRWRHAVVGRTRLAARHR